MANSSLSKATTRPRGRRPQLALAPSISQASDKSAPVTDASAPATDASEPERTSDAESVSGSRQGMKGSDEPLSDTEREESSYFFKNQLILLAESQSTEESGNQFEDIEVSIFVSTYCYRM